ncbi:hypothetical protein BW716_23840 [[Flexibacter] sp. ATCC 35208]|nr:hypothetical protein BW716_23840 [[Flexibacter] sp. ATCC 35208]
MEKKKVYRNLDIDLLFFDSNRFLDYQEALLSPDNGRLTAILNEMNGVLTRHKSKRASDKVEYSDVFTFDEQLKESSIETYDYIQHNYLENGRIVNRPDFEILQYVMLYACTAINKDKFYYNFVYNPPSQFTSVFSVFYDKWNDAGSFEIETFNPYEPYCQDPGIEEGIHYIVLTNSFLKSILQNLENLKSRNEYSEGLENDRMFLEGALRNAESGKWKAIIRIAP